MLEWTCHLRPTRSPWVGQKTHFFFTKTVRNKSVRGTPASLMNSVTALLCRPDLTLGTVVTKLGNLNTVGVIGSWVRRGQMVAPTTKGKVGVVNIMDSRVQLAIRLV